MTLQGVAADRTQAICHIDDIVAFLFFPFFFCRLFFFLLFIPSLNTVSLFKGNDLSTNEKASSFFFCLGEAEE